MKKLLFLMISLCPVWATAQPYHYRQDSTALQIREDGWQFNRYLKVPEVDSPAWYPGYKSDIWVKRSTGLLQVTDSRGDNPVAIAADIDSILMYMDSVAVYKETLAGAQAL